MRVPALLSVSLWLATFAAPAAELFVDASQSADGASGGPIVIRSRVVEVDRDALVEWGAASPSLTLNLFADTSLDFESAGAEQRDGDHSQTWRGTASDGSSAILSMRHGRLTGNVQRGNGESYRIRGREDGLHVISQVASGAGAAAAAAGENAATVDVLVAYTPAARDAAGGASQIEDLAQLTLTEAGDDSVGFRLVHSALFTPGLPEEATPAFLSYLSDETFHSEVAALQALRDEYGADIVAVWIDGPGSLAGGSASSGALSVSELSFVSGASVRAIADASAADLRPEADIETPEYLGFIDGAGCQLIYGWAADLDRPNEAIAVEFFDGEQLLGAVRANRHRPDLVAALGDDGDHGFEWTPPSGGDRTITVRVSGTQRRIGGSHELSCSGD